MPVEFTQKKYLNAAEKEKLVRLNAAYSECIKSTFLPAYILNETVNINDYCCDLRA